MTTPLRPSRPTKLETFLQAHHIKPIDLARAAEYSRAHVLRIRKGKMEPTRPCIAALVRAARKLSRQDVTAVELFDLE
jgi:predicted transcriptional regulator